HDGLAAVLQNDLGLDRHSGILVVFRPKRGDRIKVLTWDGTGLVLASTGHGTQRMTLAGPSSWITCALLAMSPRCRDQAALSSASCFKIMA
ncbi:MAG: IS66 family insertion sequence element accessory protein TnpB, partial [Pseudomonadota bacterium]